MKTKISHMFRVAKAGLKLDYGYSGNIYICHELEDAFGTEAAKPAKKVILSRIAPFDSAEGWLKDQGVATYDASFEELQSWRRAWLEQLIEEFEAKGQ